MISRFSLIGEGVKSIYPIQFQVGYPQVVNVMMQEPNSMIIQLLSESQAYPNISVSEVYYYYCVVSPPSLVMLRSNGSLLIEWMPLFASVKLLWPSLLLF